MVVPEKSGDSSGPLCAHPRGKVNAPSPTRRVGDSVLVDASNLHVGGGVQVAASLVEQFLTAGSHPWVRSATFLISSEVAANLPEAVARHGAVHIADSRPLDWRRWLPRRRLYDVSYVIFGPEYGRPRARRRIVGFADVRSVYPARTAMSVPGFQLLSTS